MDFALPEPYLYTGTQNLHIVVVCDANVSADMWPAFVARQLAHGGTTKEDLLEHQSDGCVHITNTIVAADQGSYNNGSPCKPILKIMTSIPVISVAEVFPGYGEINLSYRQGDILRADSNYLPSVRPAFTIDLNNITEEDENLPTNVLYSITGPYPSTAVVYSLVTPNPSPGYPDLPYITITKKGYEGSNYIGTEQVTKATGPMA